MARGDWDLILPPDRFENINFAQAVLSYMVPSPDAVATARKVTHLFIETDETRLRIPITYIRAKIGLCRPFLFHRASSTHEIRFEDKKGGTLVAPIHDLVFLSQCFGIQHIFSPRSNDCHTLDEHARCAFDPCPPSVVVFERY